MLIVVLTELAWASFTNLDGEDLIAVKGSNCGEAWQALRTRHNTKTTRHKTSHRHFTGRPTKQERADSLPFPRRFWAHGDMLDPRGPTVKQDPREPGMARLQTHRGGYSGMCAHSCVQLATLKYFWKLLFKRLVQDGANCRRCYENILPTGILFTN